jgi:hypothetical protein
MRSINALVQEVDREVEVVRESFPPAARPKKNPVSAATKTATRTTATFFFLFA